ncbi:MAG: hypothetical protein U1E56_09805 [Bauldia sp.]
MLNVIAGIQAAAAENSLAPAIIGGQRALAYGELLDVIARASGYVADRGLASRARVALNIGDPIFRLVISLAAMHCGAIPLVVPDLRDLRRGADYDVILGADVLENPAERPDIVVGRKAIGAEGPPAPLRIFADRADNDPLFLFRAGEKSGRGALAVETRESLRRWTGEGEGGGLALGRVDRHVSTFSEAGRDGFALYLATLAAGAVFVRPRAQPLELLRATVSWGVTVLTSETSLLFDLVGLMEAMKVVCRSVRAVAVLGTAPPKSLVARIGGVFNERVAVRTLSPGNF